MAVEVALAMLQRDGHWLMQLRYEIPSIVAPGCWRLGCGRGELDPSLSGPPVTGDQVATLALCLEMAQEGLPDAT